MKFKVKVFVDNPETLQKDDNGILFSVTECDVRYIPFIILTASDRMRIKSRVKYTAQLFRADRNGSQHQPLSASKCLLIR